MVALQRKGRLLHFPEPEQHLDAADEALFRANLLPPFASMLPKAELSPLVQASLAAAREIPLGFWRFVTLIRLSIHATKSDQRVIIAEAVEFVEAIGDLPVSVAYHRAEYTIILLRFLPDEERLALFPEALRLVTGYADDEVDTCVILENTGEEDEELFLNVKWETLFDSLIEMYSPAELLRLASDGLAIAEETADELKRSRLIISLVPYLQDVLPKAVAIARSIANELARTRALTSLGAESLRLVTLNEGTHESNSENTTGNKLELGYNPPAAIPQPAPELPAAPVERQNENPVLDVNDERARLAHYIAYKATAKELAKVARVLTPETEKQRASRREFQKKKKQRYRARKAAQAAPAPSPR
jgi:hypothetical protein